MNHFIFITGYIFKTTYFDYIELAHRLMKSNKVICGIDSEFNKYVPDESCLDDEEYKNKLSILEKLSDYLLNFKDINKSEKYCILNLYPIKIKYDNTDELNLCLYMILYNDNTINIVCDLEINSNANYMNINDNIFLNKEFEYIKISNEYNIKPIFFADLIDSLFYIIKDYSSIYKSLNRNLILLNEENIEEQNIYKLLYSSSLDFKSIFNLKDFRMINDYCLYTNEMQGLAFGKNIEKNIYYFIMLECKILNSLLHDIRIKSNLEDNVYSIRELYAIENEYLSDNAFEIYIDYVEANNYIKYVFELMNRKNVIKTIENIIKAKKIDEQNRKNTLLSILSAILSCIPLYNYIIEPIIINEFKSLTTIINGTTVILYPYNVLITLILLCILSLIFIKLFKKE